MMDIEYAIQCLEEMERQEKEKQNAWENLDKDNISKIEEFCNTYYPDLTEEEVFEEYKENELDRKEEAKKHDNSMRLSFYQLKEKGETVISDGALDIYIKFFQKNNISEDKYRLERECFFCGKSFIYKINNNFCNENCKILYENFKGAIERIERDHCQRKWNGMNKKKSLSLRTEAMEKLEEKIAPEIRNILKKSKKAKEQVKIILTDTSVELLEPEEEVIIFDDEFYKNYLIEAIKNYMDMEEFYEQQREQEEQRYKLWQEECRLSGQGEYTCVECGQTFLLANLIAENHYYDVYCKRCLYKEEEEYIENIEKTEEEQEKIIKKIRERIGREVVHGFGISEKYFKKCHSMIEKEEIIKQVVSEYSRYRNENNEQFWKELEEEIGSEIFCEEEEKAGGNLDDKYSFDEIEILE